MSGDILIVDDEPKIGNLLRAAFERDGLSATAVQEPEHALALLKEHAFEIVLTDLMMPGIDGLELLRRSKSIRPECEVVMMTAFASVETAREALKRGAVDYITKPFSVESELKPLIRAILESPRGETEVRYEEPPAPAPRAGDMCSEIKGRGKAMTRLLSRVERVARSDAPVLLRGESGSGKELVASALHRLSARSEKPMLRVNCAALPESLLESELFGHKKGSFTGADADRDGLFQAAHGGILFLDEIGEISTTFQPKLLRVLECGEFHRIGDARGTVKVDVRVIAATNRNLEEAVDRGLFRADLYYRLNVVPLSVPSLCERREDIPDLVDHFLSIHGEGRSMRLSLAARRAIESYSWPGNVRELANAIHHGVVLTEGGEISVDELPVAVQEHFQANELPEQAEQGTLEAIEVHTIRQAMKQTDYNRTQAARLLGVTRRTLGYRIRKYGLEQELEDASRTGGDQMRRVRPHGANAGASTGQDVSS